MRVALLALPLLGALPAAAAEPELAALIRELRGKGCDGVGAGFPLRHNPALDGVAQAIAAGRRLEAAMEAAGLRALQAALLELRGRGEAVRGALAKHGCDDISDPAYREFGTATRSDRAWIVLAAPFVPPAAADAAQVGRRVLELVNQARAEPRRCGRRSFAAAAALQPSESLRQAALAHARDMAARGVLSHAGHDGSTTSERVARTGYRWRFTGENIAAGQPTAERVVADWLASPRHCANLMDPDFSEMGVGYAYEPASAKGLYWAQVFAAPRH